MSNKEVMKKWFVCLDGVLSKNGIKDMSDRVRSNSISKIHLYSFKAYFTCIQH